MGDMNLDDAIWQEMEPHAKAILKFIETREDMEIFNQLLAKHLQRHPDFILQIEEAK